MGNRPFRFILYALSLMVFPSMAWPQSIPAHPSLADNGLSGIVKKDIRIFGKVTTLRGAPVSDARVHISVGGGVGTFQTVQTTLQGEFTATFNLDAQLYKHVTAVVIADKPGFQRAQEIADYGTGDSTWGIDIVLRQTEEDPDQLPVGSLIASLAPTFRSALATDPGTANVRRDATRGAAELLDSNDAVNAVASLKKAVDKSPECLACGVLLGLAMLDAGSWASAGRQFAAAAMLSPGHGTEAERADLFVVLGELEAWRQEEKKAAGFFEQALDIQPTNPLALQEMGRSLVLVQNWQAADEYLQKAVKQGASPTAHLLRARALLELGEPKEAGVEMKQYLGDRDISEFPISTRAVYSEIQVRERLKAYGTVENVVSQPLSDLYRAIPELKGLAPAADQAELPAILHKMGESVGAYFRDFPNTASLEKIRQEKILRDGKVKDTYQQSFQYLLLAKPQGERAWVEEYRTDMNGSRAVPQGLGSGFMLTSGFVSSSIYLHPDYQPGSAFRYLGKQAMNGRDTYVVAFAQRPELASIRGLFNADGVSVPVLLQGVVWLDAGSYQVVRLRTDLLNPPPNVRLEKESTEIDFEQVHFKGSSIAMWLPHEVTVTVEWKGRAFRNLHDYSDFRLFNVSAVEKQKGVEAPQDAPANPP